ncbi:MAG: helix-turn-helix domain-containing protein [Terrimicrobiaceae bacterium]
MRKEGPTAKGPAHRRSTCPLACSLDLFGDRWTLLVIRDLVLGKTRFKEFVSSPENIPTNVLSERLERLLRHKIVARVRSAESSKHLGYRLTRKGEALGPVLSAMKHWGLRWERGTRGGMAAK